MVSCHRYGHVDMRGPRRGIIYAAVCRAIANQAYREQSNSERAISEVIQERAGQE